MSRFKYHGCQVKRNGNADMQDLGWTTGFVAQLLLEQVNSKQEIADQLNRRFQSYTGDVLMLCEFDLITTDNICLKSEWSDASKQCKNLIDNGTIDWSFIVLSNRLTNNTFQARYYYRVC